MFTPKNIRITVALACLITMGCFFFARSGSNAPGPTARKDTRRSATWTRNPEHNSSGSPFTTKGPSARTSAAANEREVSSKNATQPAGILDKLDEWSVHVRSEAARDVTLNIWQGQMAAQRKDWDAAIKSFDRVLKRDPDHVVALQCKARALLAVRQYHEAAAAYERCVEIDPRDLNSRFNLTVVLIRLLETGRASDHLQEIIRQEPRHAKALYNLGMLAQRDGRLTEARDAWLQFTRLAPDVSGGWFALGVVYMDLYQPLEASRCFMKTIGIDSNRSDAFINMALSYEAMEEFEPALATLELAVELFPCDGTALSALISLHQQLAESERADATEHAEKASAMEGLLEFSDEPVVDLAAAEQVDEDSWFGN